MFRCDAKFIPNFFSGLKNSTVPDKAQQWRGADWGNEANWQPYKRLSRPAFLWSNSASLRMSLSRNWRMKCIEERSACCCEEPALRSFIRPPFHLGSVNGARFNVSIRAFRQLGEHFAYTMKLERFVEKNLRQGRASGFDTAENCSW